MPPKKQKTLSHGEIWDDSALIQSWDEALEEYRLYHSIHARGDRVERVVETVTYDAARCDSSATRPSANGHRNVPDVDDLQATRASVNADRTSPEDGEVEVEVEVEVQPTKKPAPVTSGLAPHPNPEQDKTRPRQHDHGVPLASAVGGANTDPATSPIGLIGGAVQDEALRNLMMSWYYAGYYTGLYDGQHQDQHHQPRSG